MFVIAAVIFYGAQQGWFKGELKAVTSTTTIELLDNPPAQHTNCELYLSDKEICVGDEITGEIKDGYNKLCYVYANDGSGWRIVFEGYTDANGILEKTQAINILGTFTFRALCDLNGNEYADAQDCITNPETLVVTDDIPPCPIGGGGEGDDGDFVYTCGQGSDEGVCRGTCPSTHPTCEELEFQDIISGNYYSCACINENEQEVHPDWKPDGQYHNYPEEDPAPDQPSFNEIAQQQLKDYIVQEYPAVDIDCLTNSDCPSTMNCWTGGGVNKCRYKCYDSDPTQIQSFLGYCVDSSKTYSDAENYFRTDRCAIGSLVQDKCEPDGSYQWADGSQVYSCEPVNYGACGCDFGVCS